MGYQLWDKVQFLTKKYDEGKTIPYFFCWGYESCLLHQTTSKEDNTSRKQYALNGMVKFKSVTLN